MTDTIDRRLTHGRRREDLEHERYKALFESTAVGIVVLDGSGKIADCNAAYCRLLGRDRPELLGQLANELGDDGVPSPSPELRALVAGDVDGYVAERRYSRPEGGSIWVRLTISVVSREHDRYVARSSRI